MATTIWPYAGNLGSVALVCLVGLNEVLATVRDLRKHCKHKHYSGKTKWQHPLAACLAVYMLACMRASVPDLLLWNVQN